MSKLKSESFGLNTEKGASGKKSFESFVLDLSGKRFTKKELETFLKAAPEEVYRLKGFVDLEGKTTLVNFVAGRWDLEQLEGEKKLVFIGSGIRKKEASIRKSLNTTS